MPFIRISIAGNSPSSDQTIQLQQQTTQLMVNILGKRPEVTVVSVESNAATNWSVGGNSLADSQTLVQMEAFITAGTNTEKQKSDFISAACQMLCEILDEAMSPLYVMIVEVDAVNWGYDGKTQAFRKQLS
jgi:4-oxalocrotonate tautomerase